MEDGKWKMEDGKWKMFECNGNPTESEGIMEYWR